MLTSTQKQLAEASSSKPEAAPPNPPPIGISNGRAGEGGTAGSSERLGGDWPVGEL